MNKLLETVDVESVNGLYRIYLYNDGNALPKLKIYKISNDFGTLVNNMYK